MADDQYSEVRKEIISCALKVAEAYKRELDQGTVSSGSSVNGATALKTLSEALAVLDGLSTAPPRS